MTNNNDTARLTLLANRAGSNPIDDRLRGNICATIEAVFKEELEAFWDAAVMTAARLSPRAIGTIIENAR
jgi:hypothetical protein